MGCWKEFRGAGALKEDTAGCREHFKLAVLLSLWHKNKQFNHSSQNPLWHVVGSHRERVTFFVGSCWRSRITHAHFLAWGQELSCTPASLFRPSSVWCLKMKWVFLVTLCRLGLQRVLLNVLSAAVSVRREMNGAFSPFKKKKKATSLGLV